MNKLPDDVVRCDEPYLMNPTGIRIPMNTLPDVSLRAFPESLWLFGLNVGGTMA